MPVEPAPAGQLLPESVTGPQVVSPPSEFPTSTLQGGPNPAPIVLGGREPVAAASPAPTPPPDQKANVLRLPNGMEIPVVDTRDPVAKAPAPATSTKDEDEPSAQPKKRPIKINSGALQKFMSGGPAKP